MPVPLDTTACTIDDAGITAPSFADILATLQAKFKAIYGSDSVLTPDSQDGQWLGILATIINDGNQSDIATYNSFSPTTARGAALSSVVKINGIRRLASSSSSVVLRVVGTPGTLIQRGTAGDLQGNNWRLPSQVVIPVGGQIDVTALCEAAGDVAADAGTITIIRTPTRGWQSVTNVAPAIPGAPVEEDVALRLRQARSTALAAQSPMDAIVAAVANISGVQRVQGYENAGNAADANGIPPHTIAIVAEGGDASAVILAIAAKKTPGTGTYGSTVETVVDARGVVSPIAFFPLTDVAITVQIDLTALNGYTTTTAATVQQNVVDWINGLMIGENVYLSKLWGPASLQNINPLLGETFNITGIRLARGGATPTAADVPIAFSEAAVCTLANVTITVT